MGDGRFRVAKIGGNGEELAVIDDLPGLFASAFDLEGNNGATALLLRFRQLVLRVRR